MTAIPATASKKNAGLGLVVEGGSQIEQRTPVVQRPTVLKRDAKSQNRAQAIQENSGTLPR